MKISDKDIHALMALMESTGLTDIELETPEISLTLSRYPKETTRRSERGSAPGDGIVAPVEPVELGSTQSVPAERPPPGAVPRPADSFSGDHFVTVRAPMLGTFYRAPRPGAEPFVDKGSRVGEDDTLCIIEVMKLMNQIKAGVAGAVVGIFAENGKMVEYDQPIFVIERDTAHVG